MAAAEMSLLSVDNLTVSIGATPILKGVSLAVDRGEVLGLVGESGSGKSMTALSIMRLLPDQAVAGGTVVFDGTDLMRLDERAMCAHRGRTLGMVFQEPMSALNPVKTIGAQVGETVRVHGRVSPTEAAELARAALDRVGLATTRSSLDTYPHELSGGQRQRVVIAMATVLKPKLLIADEPTTAVDVTTQARILDLLRRLAAEDDVGLILITHDLAVVADMADRIAIMKDGAVVDQGETVGLFRGLRNPYSRMLFAASIYRSERTRRLHPDEGHQTPILDVSGVTHDYRLPRQSLFAKPRQFRAVDNVSLTIRRGENLGLVGESGSGKSTLARVILALMKPGAGAVTLDGSDFLQSRGEARRDLRRHIQAVFQDPYGSLDPRYRVARLIAEPLHLDRVRPLRAERRKRVEEALTAVGLSPADGDKYPHEFSGGQRQRLAIARALITRPSLIICDEAVSALDVSIRAQILDLLADLGDRFAVSYLFISHDLTVVRAITDRVLIMRAGKIVEHGETERVFTNPSHPYTAELIAATPDLERALDARHARTATS
jgi:peptide/nickel transport system ATP-binding protein